MKTALSALFVLTLSAGPHGAVPPRDEGVAAAPRAVQTAEAGARKVDEFGDILVTTWLAHLDNFAIELQSGRQRTHPRTRAIHRAT